MATKFRAALLLGAFLVSAELRVAVCAAKESPPQRVAISSLIERSPAELIELLQDKDGDARDGAAYCLGRLKVRQAIPKLIPLLHDGNESVRQTALAALVRLDAKEAAAQIAEFLRDEDSSTRKAAIQALENLEAREMIPELIQALQDKDTAMSISAAQALGKLQAKEALPELIRLSRYSIKKASSSWSHTLEEIAKGSTRIGAVKALGELQAKEAIPALSTLLKDREVRYFAAEALGKLNAKEAIPEIITVLKDKRQGSSGQDLVVRALGKLNAKEAIPELIGLLHRESEGFRRAMIQTLAVLQAKEAVPELQQIPRDSNEGDHAVVALIYIKAGGMLPEFIRLLREHYGRNSPLYVSVNAAPDGYLWEPQAKEAIPEFTQLLRDKHGWMRQLAAEALRELRAKEAIPELIGLLRDKDVRVRRTATSALRELSAEQAIPELLGLLRDEDVWSRRNAVAALLHLNVREAAPRLVPLLRDSEPHVRDMASTALVGLKARETIPQLTLLLHDGNKFVRVKAINILGALQAREAIPQAIQLLQDSDDDVRSAAIVILGKLQAKEAVPQLTLLLHDRKKSMRVMAIDTLEQMQAKESVPSLIGLLDDNSARVRLAAAQALIGLEAAHEAIPEFIRLLFDQDNFVRGAADLALNSLKAETAISRVLPLLHHGDQSVRVMAIGLIANLKAKEAIPELEKLLTDGDSAVRESARRFLNTLNGKDAKASHPKRPTIALRTPRDPSRPWSQDQENIFNDQFKAEYNIEDAGGNPAWELFQKLRATRDFQSAVDVEFLEPGGWFANYVGFFTENAKGERTYFRFYPRLILSHGAKPIIVRSNLDGVLFRQKITDHGLVDASDKGFNPPQAMEGSLSSSAPAEKGQAKKNPMKRLNDSAQAPLKVSVHARDDSDRDEYHDEDNEEYSKALKVWQGRAQNCGGNIGDAAYTGSSDVGAFAQRFRATCARISAIGVAITPGSDSPGWVRLDVREDQDGFPGDVIRATSWLRFQAGGPPYARFAVFEIPPISVDVNNHYWFTVRNYADNRKLRPGYHMTYWSASKEGAYPDGKLWQLDGSYLKKSKDGNVNFALYGEAPAFPLQREAAAEERKSLPMSE